jgi:NADP-dependent 3-hydroxy acid dehydrogenase YdfG
MTDHVAGKSIIITGAGNGFGRLAAQRLAARGARLTCVDIDADAARATATSIRTAGGEAIDVTADVASIAEMRAAAAAAIAAHGAIDVIVNNAGIMPLAFIADHEAAIDAWNRCIDINLKGVVNGTAAVHDQMIAQGHGHIINLSSIFANTAVIGGAVYGATKAAVAYFSESVRQEARGKIKVTIVRPGGVLSTGLSQTVVNIQAAVGAVGPNQAEFAEAMACTARGEARPEWSDPESMAYFDLGPEQVVDAIIHSIDQPRGVAISDITVRPAGDFYVL